MGCKLFGRSEGVCCSSLTIWKWAQGPWRPRPFCECWGRSRTKSPTYSRHGARQMGLLEQEVVVKGTVREVADGRAIVDTVAEQGGNEIIRNAEAELEI